MNLQAFQRKGARSTKRAPMPTRPSELAGVEPQLAGVEPQLAGVEPQLAGAATRAL